MVWHATWPWALILFVGPPFYFLTETPAGEIVWRIAALVIYGDAS